MNKKFFTLAAGLLLSSAFATAQVAVTGEDKNIVTVDKEGGVEVTYTDDTKGYATSKFVSGKAYYVAMTGNDEELAETEFFLGLSKVGANLTPANVKAEDVDLANDEDLVWVVSKTTGSDGKLYYSFYNPYHEVYLAFANGDEGPTLVNKVANAVANKEGQSSLFAFGDNAEYDGSGQLLRLSATTDKFLNLASASSITGVATGNYKFVLYEAAEYQYKKDDLNSLYANDGGFSLKFATEPDENIFGQNLLACDITDVNQEDYGKLPVGTYIAVTHPRNGIESFDDFKASTFITLDLNNKYDLNGLSNANGEGYGFTTVKGSDLVAAPNYERGEIPAANAAFKVVEKEPTDKPGMLTLSLNATVVKDKKYSGGKAVNVYVANSNSKKILTTAAASTLAELGASNNVKPETILKTDAPAVYNIKFTSGAADVTKATSSEYGKYLMVNSTGAKWGLFADGSAYTVMEGPAAQWTVESVTEDGEFVFRNRETNVKITLGLSTIDGKTTISFFDADEVTENEDQFTYGYVDAEGKHVSSANAKNVVGTTIELVEVKTIDPLAGYLDISDRDLAYGPVKIGFHSESNLIADDLYLNVTTGTTVKPEKTAKTYWNITKWDRSAADLQAAKSDTIMNVKGYAYWDATKKEVKTVATGDTVAVLAYSFSPVNSDQYLQADGANVGVAEGKFVFRKNADGSLSMVKADALFTAVGTHAASISNTGAVEWDKALPINNIQANTVKYNAVSLTQDAMVSLEGESRHAALQSVNGGFIGIGEENEAILAVKEEAGKALTFWLDTADAETYLPSFYISRATTLKAEGDRLFLFNPTDSATYYNAGAASVIKDPDYFLGGDVTRNVKAIFRPATLVNADTLTTTINGKEATIATVANAETKVLGGLNAYKFNIVLADEDTEDEYVIRSLATAEYLVNINGKLAFSNVASQALVINLAEGDATANEAIAAEADVKVIGGQGAVTVQGAAGKVITVANVLGQTIANQVAASDNVTIAAPAGIVVVAVEGEATKVVVK